MSDTNGTAPQASNGHLYDFSGGTITTTDPVLAGKLSYGPQNRVMLNGEDITPLTVRRFRTGPDGWVDVLRLNEGDPVRVNVPETEVEEYRLPGNVEFRIDDAAGRTHDHR